MKFPSLHNHSTFSTFDGFGYPEQFMDSCYELGIPAYALTEHGHMNSLPYAFFHHKKMKAEGKDIKLIYGVEFYFIPSIKGWHKTYEDEQLKKKKIKKSHMKISSVVSEDENRSTKSKLNRRRHIVLLAQNEIGLRNLFKLVYESFRRENFYRFPRIDFRLLQKHSEGLIGTSACIGGVLSEPCWKLIDEKISKEQAIKKIGTLSSAFSQVLNGNWYGELQWNDIPEQHIINKLIIEASQIYDIPLVTTCDAHYPRKENWQHRELYKRMGFMAAYDQEMPENYDQLTYRAHPKNYEQICEEFKRYEKDYDYEVFEESLKNACRIADQIEQVEIDTSIKLPNFLIETEDATKEFEDICRAGLDSLDIQDKDTYKRRLEFEIDVIEKNGFERYFLTMKKISDLSQEKYLSGSGRGSAAGSLVAYVLGITQIDPIKHGTMFSRFMSENQASIGMPDIDFDVSHANELKKYFVELWGETRFVKVSNFNRFKLRSTIKDVAKFFDVPYQEVNDTTSVMEAEAMSQAKEDHGIKAGVYTPTFEEVKKYSKSLQKFFENYPHVADYVENLYLSIRSVSAHAGGVIIHDDLTDHLPIINSGGVFQSPWCEGVNVRHLEPLGFIKFDLLGVTTLAIIERCIQNILKKQNKDYDFLNIKKFYDENLNTRFKDCDDEQVWKKVFHDGLFVGIFQFDKENSQTICKNIKPDNIDELSAITSINRPGPLASDVDKIYEKFKKNPELINCEHPIVEKILSKTYGQVIYQEDVAQIAHEMGKNISLDEGNLLRKVFTKWLKDISSTAGKQLPPEKQAVHDNLKNKFIDGCIEKGLTEEGAEEFWKKLHAFSGYSFNFSHALSYSVISYQCAWLLTYYKAEWCCAFLDYQPDRERERAVSIVKGVGVDIQPASINCPNEQWSVVDDETIIRPLTAIKGVKAAAMKRIAKGVPFSTIEDVMKTPGLNKAALSSLICANALNNLKDKRFKNLRHFWLSVIETPPISKFKDGIDGRLTCFHDNIEEFKDVTDFTDKDRIQILIELTGEYPYDMVISPQTLQKLEDLWVSPISEYDKETGLVWFITRKVTKRTTKKNRKYYELIVSDSINSTLEKVRIWGILDKKDFRVYPNRVYMAMVEHNEEWGFSIKNMIKNLKMLK